MPTREIEFRVQARGLSQRGHLIVQHRPEQVGVNLSFPVGPAPWRAAPVGYQDREALLREPLRYEAPPLPSGGDPLPACSAVRVDQDWQLPAVRAVPGRKVQHAAQFARPEYEPRRVHVKHRLFHQ